MNKKYKIYLLLGLLFSTTKSTVFAYTAYEDYNIAQIEEYCNNIIQSIFECFFNDQDTTQFSQIIKNIINALKEKRNILNAQLQKQYDEIIALLDINKDHKDFKIWGNIFLKPELKAILPQQTQDYLDSIPNFKKVKTLINKLNK